MWSVDHLLDAAAPHHYRTRSSGEQRGVTVKPDGTCESPCQPSTQVSTPIQARMTAPSQAESASSILVTRSSENPQVVDRGFFACRRTSAGSESPRLQLSI
jgi:hypothetical protein